MHIVVINDLKVSMEWKVKLISDILPKSQVQAFQFPVHISYLLQKCKKKQTREKEFALFKNDITTSESTF